MEELLKLAIPSLQWPEPFLKAKRAIHVAEEHPAIVQREPNTKRWDYYERVWQHGRSTSNTAWLLAEDFNWDTDTISYSRKKRESRALVELSCGDGV